MYETYRPPVDPTTKAPPVTDAPHACGVGPNRCPAVWYGTEVQHCTVCHQSFSGSTSGDAHRVGPYEPPNRRRCLEPEELEALGLWLDKRNVWHGKPNKEGIQHRRQMSQ